MAHRITRFLRGKEHRHCNDQECFGLQRELLTGLRDIILAVLSTCSDRNSVVFHGVLQLCRCGRDCIRGYIFAAVLHCLHINCQSFQNELSQRCVQASFSNHAASSSTRPNLSSGTARGEWVLTLVSNERNAVQPVMSTAPSQDCTHPCSCDVLPSCTSQHGEQDQASRSHGKSYCAQQPPNLDRPPTSLSPIPHSFRNQVSTPAMKLKVCRSDLSVKVTTSGMSSGTP